MAPPAPATLCQVIGVALGKQSSSAGEGADASSFLSRSKSRMMSAFMLPVKFTRKWEMYCLGGETRAFLFPTPSAAPFSQQSGCLPTRGVFLPRGETRLTITAMSRDEVRSRATPQQLLAVMKMSRKNIC